MRAALAVLAAAVLLALPGAVQSGFTSTAGAAGRFAAAPVFPPRLLEPPAISGPAVDGETLTAARGTWAREPASFRIEWLRCDEQCRPVGEGEARELTAEDAGARMRVRVTATNDGGSTTATSEATPVVAPLAPPDDLAAPAISGTARVGETLAASDGEWSGRRLTLTRRWLRCTTTCSAIAGEGDASYLVTGDDAGATIRVEVTATNASGHATAVSAPTAAVTRATYAQLLCANPATGRGVAADGALPSGLRTAGTLTDRFDPRPQTRCATGTTTPVIPLSTGGTYSTTVPDDRIVLQYYTAPDTDFRFAVIYRQGTMSGRWSWSVQSASTTNLFASPLADLCSWGSGCTSRGSTTDRFGRENRVHVTTGAGEGFNVVLGCDIGSGSRCDADGSQVVRLFGGRIALVDTATPKVTARGGGLLGDAPLEPVEDLSLSATDAGAGLFRVRVSVAGREVAVRPLHDNGGRCADHDPATSEPEFAFRQPCVLSLATSMSFDTSGWPAAGRLRVLLEDAGGNTTVVANRQL